MNAFFYIDKPSWCTSFDVLRDMRRKLGIKKFWHTGTLDPLASWGLLVASGNYTKLLSYLHADTKSYTADIMLDGTSPSLDRDTEISFLPESVQLQAQKHISHKDIEKLLSEFFTWEIEQIPPSYSALKIDGKKALDRVLAGEELELNSRSATIYESEILEYRYPLLRVSFRVSAGTYIRSIARDIGEKLWLWGYISELRRTQVWDLDLSQAITLDELTQDTTLAPKLLFWDAYREFFDEEIYARLSNGQRVRSEQDWQSNTSLFLADTSAIRFVVEYREGVIHPIRKV
jgi:tRNA pseudouridine55 synthase